MTNQHPITPPLELVMQWDTEAASTNMPVRVYIATEAARWGADQKLEACCDVIARELICDGEHLTGDLRTERRPGLPISSYQETPTLQEANVGDTLEDGSIVLQKSKGVALLVAPLSTEVEATWSKEFPEVFEALKEQGFNPSQWFIPTKEHLWLAYQSIPNEFALECDYWSSTEFDVTHAYGVDYFGDAGKVKKSCAFCVRAFRCVTY